MSVIARLTARGIAHPPRWLPTNTHYETIMGSVAYGVSADTSDMDVYGFAIPPKDDVFPHLRGEVLGFGRPIARFEQYQEHHLLDPDALAGRGRSHDIVIYSIVKFFQLAMENNPNIIDSLFTPVRCVLHCTRMGTMVREARREFLHKGAWHKFKGYAYAQLHKLTNKEPQGKRAELVAKHGYDTKFAYHIVRLLDEVEQILTTGDVDLERDSERLKAIRRGEWTEPQVRAWFTLKEHQLEQAHNDSRLPHAPPEEKIRELLLHCLEEHYGNLQGCITNPNRAVVSLRAIQAELDKVRDLWEEPPTPITHSTNHSDTKPPYDP